MILCRPETPSDEPFLRTLVLETIVEELGAGAWPEQIREPLLRLQYDVRRGAARSAPGVIASQIIVADNEEAGWQLTSEVPDEIRIVQIMIASRLRGRGLGAAAIGQVLDRAAHNGKPVRLSVNCSNARAIRLYERLGFRVTESDTAQQQMEWTPRPANLPSR